MNDKTFLVNTHLGETLNFNDTVLGYDLDMMNITELEDNSNFKREIPSVVLVKKTFPKYRKKHRKQNNFKLKQLDKEAIDEHNLHKKDKSSNKHQRDYDLFMQDVLEDPEIRHQIDLYKADASTKKKTEKRLVKLEEDDDDESEEEDFPMINESELKTMEDKLS